MRPEDMYPGIGDPADSPALVRRREQFRGGGAAIRPGTFDDMDAQPNLLAGMERASDLAPDIPPPPQVMPELTAERDHGVILPKLARSSPWPILLAGGAVVIVAGVGLWIYESWSGGDQPGEVPLILAEEGPEKVRPAEEGGMEVPNQDVLIYDEIGGEVRPAEPETLLPEPEAPLALPMPAEKELPSDETETTSTDDEALAEWSAVEEDVDIPMIAAPSPETEPAAGTEPAEPTVEPSEAVDDMQSAAQVAVVAGAYRVQLAAVKSEAAAKAAWNILSKLHRELLGGLSLRVEEVDRGADGVLYRVQAGPLADRALAQGVCAQLKIQNQPCLVVAP